MLESMFVTHANPSQNGIDFQFRLTTLAKQNICTKALQNLPQTLEAPSIFPHYEWGVPYGSLTTPIHLMGKWMGRAVLKLLHAPLLNLAGSYRARGRC